MKKPRSPWAEWDEQCDSVAAGWMGEGRDPWRDPERHDRDQIENEKRAEWTEIDGRKDASE